VTEQQKLAAKDQQKKLDKLMKYYDKGYTELGLFGKAGVGKTYCAKQLVNRIIEKSNNLVLQVYGAAISHSAKNILQKSLGENIKCYTIASLLQSKKVYLDDGTVDFVPSKKFVNGKWSEPPIKSADILIIDECSQISDTTLDRLYKYRKGNSVIIFLGDWRQTPPPEESKEGDSRDSKTFDVKNVKLKIPFRYEGDLQKFNDAIGEQIDNFNKGEDISLSFLSKFAKDPSKEYSFWRTDENFIEEYIKTLLNNTELKNSTLICYKNKTVAEKSKEIRQKLLQTDSPYVKGDRLVCKKTYYKEDSGYTESNLSSKDSLTVEKETTYEGFLIQNSSLYEVQLVEESEVNVYFVNGKYFGIDNITISNTGKAIFNKELTLDEEIYFELVSLDLEEEGKEPNVVKTTIPTFNLTLKGADSKGVEDESSIVTVPVLQNKNNTDYVLISNLLHNIAKRKNKGKFWKDYYTFVEFFAHLEYAYAVNTYVVQGDTYSETFVDFRDILSVKPINAKQKLQSFYTAVSRAKKQVQILI
jgi:hypothetical protein